MASGPQATALGSTVRPTTVQALPQSPVSVPHRHAHRSSRHAIVVSDCDASSAGRCVDIKTVILPGSSHGQGQPGFNIKGTDSVLTRKFGQKDRDLKRRTRDLELQRREVAPDALLAQEWELAGVDHDTLHREQADRPRPSIPTRDPCCAQERSILWSTL